MSSGQVPLCRRRDGQGLPEEWRPLQARHRHNQPGASVPARITDHLRHQRVRHGAFYSLKYIGLNVGFYSGPVVHFCYFIPAPGPMTCWRCSRGPGGLRAAWRGASLWCNVFVTTFRMILFSPIVPLVELAVAPRRQWCSLCNVSIEGDHFSQHVWEVHRSPEGDAWKLNNVFCPAGGSGRT